MAQRGLSYIALQQQVTRQSISHFLWKGLGWPLVCVWLVGAGALMFLLNSPPLALVWTVQPWSSAW